MRTSPTRPQVITGLALVAAALLGSRPAPCPAAPEPAKKDSRPASRPREATLTGAVTPAEAKAGDRVTFRVTAKLEPGWHIYTYAKQPIANGPQNTTFDLFDTGGLKVEGDWTASKPPIRRQEPAFPNLPFLEFYEDEVTWSITLLVPPGIEPGKKILRCQAGYQICNERSCAFPGRWTLPDVALTIAPGGTAASLTPQDAAPAAVVTKSGAAEPPAAATTPAVSSTDVRAASPSLAEKPHVVTTEGARRAEQGLIAFLIWSALGGLAALAMPCVWPMVPITVNFFIKQGQHKGRTLGLAIIYCLAIIGVFTSLGVLCSFFFSESALQNLANNAWLNLAIALLFVAFGLSLLGVFDIRLPSFLLNASARGESRGGLVGVVFMALTLTITSFTCTFPVVGTLIVMAGRGEFFYPIVGLATFATVLALPFFLLALAPSLVSRIPKSGDWMNGVKIVGGLIEIGAALKFLNTAEISFGTLPDEAFFNAPVVLSSWVVLTTVSGVYLLGLFRTDHDHNEIKVGAGRILAGSLFLGIALFLAPALFGRPPESKVWYTLVGLLPPDATNFGRLAANAGGLGPSAGCEEVKAQSHDPKIAEREEKRCHGVLWGLSLAAAKEEARAARRPILIDFTGVNCANCRTMETGVMPRPEIVSLLKQFVTVQLYTDFVQIASISRDDWEELAAQNQAIQLSMGNVRTNPYYVVLTADGEVLKSQDGPTSPAGFAEFLKQGLAKFEAADKVAQAGPGR